MKYNEDYLREGGDFCPYCHSSSIEGHGWDTDFKCIDCSLDCSECGREWQEHYSLEYLIEVKSPSSGGGEDA